MSTILVVFTLFLRLGVECLDNGLALTPPMGWMSWQRYQCEIDCDNYPDDCISESLYTRMADLMVEEGYLEAGYEYVIIDDCWMEFNRSESGKLVPDQKRFPRGIKYIADYVHNKGMKFGLYEDYGTATCAGYPGVMHHMELDANTFAEWDVDYVKLDGCNSDSLQKEEGYPKFGELLNATGRPMVYSCSWPAYLALDAVNFEKLKMHCNLWRNYHDIDDSWNSVKSIAKFFANNQNVIQPHAGPGHFNDPDMLIIGNFGLSIDQSKAQMALWAILAAPLIMSNDLKAIRPEFKEILLNKEIITINQDKLGLQGRRLVVEHDIETWVRQILPARNNLEHTSYAVAFVNLRSYGSPFFMTVHLSKLGLNKHLEYAVTDLYSSQSLKNINGSGQLSFRVNPSGVMFYKFTLVEDLRI